MEPPKRPNPPVFRLTRVKWGDSAWRTGEDGISIDAAINCRLDVDESRLKSWGGQNRIKNQRRRRKYQPIWTNQTVCTLTVAACAAEMSVRIFSLSVLASTAVSLNAGGRLDSKLTGADRTKDPNRKYCSRMITEGRKQIGTLLVQHLYRNKSTNIKIWPKIRAETKMQIYLILGVRFLISVDF